MRAFITNDDGVESQGIRILAAAALAAGFEVTVGAPSWDSSGASASLTSVEHDGRFLVEERVWPESGVDHVYAVEAAPAFIVRAAVNGAFGPEPDIVLSGVNHGFNAGRAVLHSGTVGAALTAYNHGKYAMAASMAAEMHTPVETSTDVVVAVLGWLIKAPTPVVLNVNVPNVSRDALHGIVRARLASFGAVQTVVTETGRGYVKLGYSDVDNEPEPGTDVAYLLEGYATVTPLEAVCESETVDTSEVERAIR
jgi:5'-nucleotidase